MREPSGDPARSESHGMRGTAVHENREVPCPPVQLITGRAAQGTLRRYAWDERAWEVGSSRSTCEPAEQGYGRGGGGGKATSRGEHGQQNTSRTQRRAGCVKCAGPCAASGTSG